MAADAIKTLAMILAELPDNTIRAIRPQYSREIARGAFGAILDREPTVLDDKDNSAGAGFFDAGSWWLNQAGLSLWRCFNGQHHLADWRKIWPPPPALPEHIRGTVERVVPAVATLSGLCPIGFTTLPAGTVVITNDVSDNTTIGAWVTGGTPWTRAAWWPDGQLNQEFFFVWVQFNGADGMDGLPYLVSVESPFYDLASNPQPWTVGVDVPIVQDFVANMIVGVPVEFQENALGLKLQTLGLNNGLHWQNQPAGYYFRRDTGTGAPSFGPIDAGHLPIIPKSAIDPTGTWMVSEIPGLPASIIVSGTFAASLIPPNIGGFSPYQVVVTDATGVLSTIGAMGNGQLVIGSAGVGPAIGSLASSDASVTITPGPGTIDLKVAGGGGGGGFTWTKYTVDFSAVGGDVDIPLATLATTTTVMACMYRITSTWSYVFSQTGNFQIRFSGGARSGSPTGVFSSNPTLGNGALAAFTYLNDCSGGSQLNEGGCLMFVRMASGGFAALSGHLELWVATSTLP